MGHSAARCLVMLPQLKHLIFLLLLCAMVLASPSTSLTSLASQPSLASAVEVEEEVKFSKEELATLTTAAEVEQGLLAGSSRREQALLWKVAAVERALACEVTARKDAVEELATLTEGLR